MDANGKNDDDDDDDDDDGDEILKGYKDEIDNLKKNLKKFGINYKVNESEYPDFYQFLKGRGYAKELSFDTPFYRARKVEKPKEKRYIGRSELFKGFCKTQCGAPPANSCRGQRVSSEYQRYLYCALEDYTALAEVRPYLDEQISIAEFKLKSSRKTKPIKLFDLTRKINPYIPTSCQPYSCILSTELSKPVADRDKQEDYFFTQYISNLIRLEGFDGIMYNSSLNENGNNIALFDPEIVKPISSRLYTLSTIYVSAYDNGEEGMSFVRHVILEKYFKKYWENHKENSQKMT